MGTGFSCRAPGPRARHQLSGPAIVIGARPLLRQVARAEVLKALDADPDLAVRLAFAIRSGAFQQCDTDKINPTSNKWRLLSRTLLVDALKSAAPYMDGGDLNNMAKAQVLELLTFLLHTDMRSSIYAKSKTELLRLVALRATRVGHAARLQQRLTAGTRISWQEHGYFTLTNNVLEAWFSVRCWLLAVRNIVYYHLSLKLGGCESCKFCLQAFLGRSTLQNQTLKR